MNIISFFISSLIIVLLPGSGVIYTISTGITKGKKASIFAALGCTSGIIPHLCFSIVLSSLMLQMGSRIFNLVKVLGALYLLYLGIGMIASKSKVTFENTQGYLNAFATARQGLLINLLNPQLTIFFFSLFPQYISANNKDYLSQCIMLGLTFMLLTLIVFIVYGALAGSAKKFIEKSPHTTNILQKCFGIIFVILSFQLGFSSIK
jgi:threonine/homoserine/homoserine lactone efflux protein